MLRPQMSSEILPDPSAPTRAVIRDHGNPVGEAVVWYVHHRGSIIISCFVPADAV